MRNETTNTKFIVNYLGIAPQFSFVPYICLHLNCNFKTYHYLYAETRYCARHAAATTLSCTQCIYLNDTRDLLTYPLVPHIFAERKYEYIVSKSISYNKIYRERLQFHLVLINLIEIYIFVLIQTIFYRLALKIHRFILRISKFRFKILIFRMYRMQMLTISIQKRNNCLPDCIIVIKSFSGCMWFENSYVVLCTICVCVPFATKSH